MSLCFASASLLSGYSGILARAFSTIILSRLPLSRRSPLPFPLFASWLLVSPFVSFSTFSGVLLRLPDSMRLCASSSFISFPRFFQDVLFDSISSFSFLRVLLMAAYYFFYFTVLCPFVDPFDRMWVWLFFFYLCRLILIRLPLPVLVGSPCHPSMQSLPHVLDFLHVVPTSWVLSRFPPPPPPPELSTLS